LTFDWTRTSEEGGQGHIRNDWRLHNREGCIHASAEREGVKEADVLILLLGPQLGGVGCFVEFGIAAGLNKEIWVVGRQDYERDSVFFCLPGVMHLNTERDLRDLLYLRRDD
jgi:hypothetical protein